MRCLTFSLLLNIVVHHHCQDVWNLTQPCLWDPIQAHLPSAMCSVTSMWQFEFFHSGKVYTIGIGRHYRLWIPKANKQSDALPSQGEKAWVKTHSKALCGTSIPAVGPSSASLIMGASQTCRREEKRWSCRRWWYKVREALPWGSWETLDHGGNCRGLKFSSGVRTA